MINFLLTWAVAIFVGLFFAYILVVLIRNREVSLKLLWYGVLVYTVLSIFRIMLWGFIIYHSWQTSNDIAKYFTLPYSHKIYQLIGSELGPLGVSLTIGAALYGIFFLITKKGRQWLTPQEIVLLCFGVAISGWPVFFIFLGLVFVLTVIIKLLRVALKKEKMEDRISVMLSIPLAVIITIYFGNQLAVWTGLFAIR